VQTTGLTDSQYAEVQCHRSAQVAKMIVFDAKHYGLKQLDSTQVLSVLKTVDSTEVQSLSPKQINIVNQVIYAYFQSDASDLIIDSEPVVEKVLSALKPLYTNSMPKETDVTSVLQQHIPLSVYADDPEAIDYAAPALTSLIIERRQRAMVNNITDKILELSADIPATEYASFRRDIHGDIWILVQDYTGIPDNQATFRDISALPADSNVTLTSLQAGMPIIFKNLDANILKSQVFSLAVAYILVFILLSFRFRSLTGGLISLAPITTTILFNFILMAVLDIPLDAVTVLIGSVAVGIGIDYTIHFLTRFQREFQGEKSPQEALHTTLQTSGRAILINAASVMMGFLVLVFGNIVPMQRFGYLIAVTMVISALGAITLLPALILVTKARFIGDFDRVAKHFHKQLNGLKTIGRRGIIK
jgi:predicted RND superfamily exporter protein